jgi:hypothetical protein
MAWASSADIPPSPFYTNGTFWAGVGSIATLVSIVVLGWITWRAANPKRRQLWYSMTTVTPPATTGTGNQPDDPKISDSDRPGKSLATVNIQLVSRGRLDIPRSAFDGDQPLQVDVGAPIVKVDNVKKSPNRTEPPLETDSSKLFVGPCLIGRRETIVITLLVEGDPHLGPLHPAPENVDIRRGRPLAIRISILIQAALVLLLATIVIYLLGWYVPDVLARRHTNPAVESAWIIAVATLLGVAATAAVAIFAFWYSRAAKQATIKAAKDITDETVRPARETNEATIAEELRAATDEAAKATGEQLADAQAQANAAAGRLAEATAAFAAAFVAELSRIREETQARIGEIQTSAAEAIQQAKANADAAVTDAEGRTAAAEQRAQKAIEQARAEAAIRVAAAEADRDQAHEQAERYRQDTQRADQRGAAVDARTEDVPAREDATP